MLHPLPVSTPRFYGLYKDEITGEKCFIIEYLDQCMRGSFDPTQYHAAARWLGQFHKANETDLSPTLMSFLNKHDAEDYLGWSEKQKERERKCGCRVLAYS